MSDGAKQHFKNRYQMWNLMYHKNDFDVYADWRFFATAHGKSSCVGIGATGNREAVKASLQASANEFILNVEALFSWATSKRNFDLHFFCIPKMIINDYQFLSKKFNMGHIKSMGHM